MQVNFRRARNLQRYRKLVAVLARHGFGSILEALHLDRYLPLPSILFKQTARPADISPAEHFRMALEELGPTFIKLGQVFSTRPDLFPPPYIVELTKLQDRVPPTPWDTLQSLLREEYGREPDEIFSRLEPQPLGSASLSQVHAAALQDGTEVVLKVQRPNIQRTISADLDILNDLAGLAQRTAWGQLYNPIEIVAQFSFTLHNELDYRREGLNADRFRKNFLAERHLYIPIVYWEYSTERVLVMERLRGIKIDRLDELDAAGFDRRRIAELSAGIIAKEILEDGFFHADPHPGNFLVMPHPGAGDPPGDGIVGAMDFGMVGYISKMERLNMLQALALAAKSDSHGIVDHMVRIGAVSSTVDLQALERDVDRLLNQYRGLPLKYIQTRRVMEEIMQIAFHYRVNLPPDLWLLLKTLTMMDGLARQLDPDFDIFSVFTPHARRMMVESHMPWVWGPTIMADLEALSYALRDLPSIGESLLRNLQHGQLPFSVSVGGSKETLDRLDRLSTRFSLSVLTAAFILGLALLLPLASANRLAMILVAIGFFAALMLGVWVVFSILRSGK